MPYKLRIRIYDAKYNPKYYMAKKFRSDKPRVKEADVSNLRHYCEPEGITVKVEGNTLTFEKDILGDADFNIILDGKDTGGQFIRLVVSYMINYGEGRFLDVPTIELPKFSESDRVLGKKGKATMLMLQMIKLTLGVGQTATFKYGDVANSDARHISEMPVLFDILRKVFGINFRLDNDGEECYTLHRMEDVEPQLESILKIDNHMADEVLFTAISLWALGKQIPKIRIETPVSRDYHIGAMVKFGKVLGMNIEDSKPEGEREVIRDWISKEKIRTINIE